MLQLGLVLLYHKISDKLSFKLTPPSKTEVQSLMDDFDVDHNGFLDYLEFKASVERPLL